MKEWFKYEYGYVNVDSENLYFTSSGNWSETRSLNEKTKSTAVKNTRRSNSVILFLAIMLLLFGLLIIEGWINGRFSLVLIALVICGGYKLYEYLKTEIGAKFKVPLNKIVDIRQGENGTDFFFINGEGFQDVYTITGIDEKGIAIISAIRGK